MTFIPEPQNHSIKIYLSYTDVNGKLGNLELQIFRPNPLKSTDSITSLEFFKNFYGEVSSIALFSQKEIKANGKKYIVDFYFEEDEYVNKFNTDKKIIIECDGYEFHQKTKEQVQKDNEREYNLKMAGYEILRFSGTQIYNNPFKCAEDTYNYIIKRIGE